MQPRRVFAATAAFLLAACGSDSGSSPRTGTVEAWADKYVFIATPGDTQTSEIELYNGTDVSIVAPRCQVAAGNSPYDLNPTIVGLYVLKERSDGSWAVWGGANIPPCSGAPDREYGTLSAGFHGLNQSIRIPEEPGRYSWVIPYHPSEASSQLLEVATPAVTVLPSE